MAVQCTECDRSFETERGLIRHSAVHKPKKPKAFKVVEHKCEQCDLPFKGKHGLAMHNSRMHKQEIQHTRTDNAETLPHSTYLAGYITRTVEEYARGNGVSAEALTRGLGNYLIASTRR